MDEIKRLYQEATEALAKGRAILDEFKGKEMPKEKADEAAKWLDEAEAKSNRAKELERAEALKNHLDEGTNRLNAYQQPNTPPPGTPPAKVKWQGKELDVDELAVLQKVAPFAGFIPTADEAYDRYAKAMRAYIRKNQRDLSAAELKDLSVGEAQAGGYLQQDTYINELLVKARQRSAMRRICRVLPPVPTGAAIVPIEDSLFSDAAWTSEVKTGSADTVEPFGDRKLQPHPLAKRVLVSNTFFRSPTFDAEAYVRDRLGYKFGIAGENGYINGSGAQQPMGLLNTSGLPVWTTAASNTVDSDDVINWVYSLPAAYAANATILCNRAFVRKVRTMTDGTGAYVWQPGLQIGSPNRILDVPYEFSDQFDDGLDGSDLWEDNAKIAVIGDFSYFWIVDALQLSVQRLVELYAETNQTGYIGRMETDGMAVLAEAFYALKVKA